jgi:Fic family protein
MAGQEIKKTETFKSGFFVFSTRYDQEKLIKILIEINVLYTTVNDLPILPSLATRIQEDIIRKSIFGTAAIEGNPLSEETVGEILSGSGKGKTKETAEIEIRNLKAAYDELQALRISESIFRIDEERIRTIHKVVTSNIQHPTNEPGLYRSNIVKVGDVDHGGVYTPPKCLDDIKNLMQEFIQWINSEPVIALPPPVRAALAHYHFALIHPFADGNGRTARLIEAYLLRLAGMRFVPIMLSNFYYQNIHDYFRAFSECINSQDHNVTPFIEFMLKGCLQSLYEIKDSITFLIRKFTLKDFYAHLHAEKQLTQRQHDLICVILDRNYNSTPVSLKDMFLQAPFNVLYRNVSERTARRDLEKLCSMNLLLETEKKNYLLNINALDT